MSIVQVSSLVHPASLHLENMSIVHGHVLSLIGRHVQRLSLPEHVLGVAGKHAHEMSMCRADPTGIWPCFETDGKAGPIVHVLNLLERPNHVSLNGRHGHVLCLKW